MASKKKTIEITTSRQLEEHIEIPFTLVGTSEWLATAISDSVQVPTVRVSCPKDLEPIMVWLRSQKVLGIDSETGGDNKRDGLDPMSISSRMLLFQIGTPEMVYLIEPALVPVFKESLEDEKFLFITQNGMFDFKFVLMKYGIHFLNYYYEPHKEKLIPCVYDTMLAEQILTAGLFGVSVGLEELAEKYDPHYLISKAVRKEFIDMTGVLEYRHLYYAARDVYLLFAIRDHQLNEIKKHKGMLERVNIEFCATPGTADAELTGFDLDEVRIGATLDYYKSKAANIRIKVTDLFNDYLDTHGQKRIFILPETLEEFDLDSASQKLAALRRMGFELDDVKRETLQDLDSEITNLLGEYSECTKIISTYGEGLLSRRSKTTGRLHPEFNQLGAGDLERKKGAGKATTIATGRWSSDAQQFPRPDHLLDPVVGARAEEIKALFATEYEAAQQTLSQEEK